MSKNINSNVTDIKADVKALNNTVNEVDKRITMVEKEQETMWIRIDELKEKTKV